jgi:hypothetical protein
MQHLEGSGTPVLYMGREVLLKVNLVIHFHQSFKFQFNNFERWQGGMT